MINKSIILCLFVCFLFAGPAFALLNNNGNGTVTQTRNDGSILMWLQDANTPYTSGYCSIPENNCDNQPYNGLMTWDQANTWIGSLNNSNYLGHNDWRLPNTLPVNGSSYDTALSYNGSTDFGWNISAPGNAYPSSTGSELAYMYYTELGNLGHYDISGNVQNGVLSNTGPFNNMGSIYWSGTQSVANPDTAWLFVTGDGYQYRQWKDVKLHAWAVRSVSGPIVPEPISSILFITGGTLLAGRRYIKRKIKT